MNSLCKKESVWQDHSQGRPWLASRNLDFGKAPTIPRAGRRGSLCLNHTNKWFMLNILFPPASLEWKYVPGKGCLCGWPPIKHLGTGSVMSLLGREHVTCVVTAAAGGVKHILYDSTERTCGSWHPISCIPNPMYWSLCWSWSVFFAGISHSMSFMCWVL